MLTTARTRVVAVRNSAVDRLPEEVPKALQTSECSDLLDLARTRYMIRAQRQPGKFNSGADIKRLINITEAKRCYQNLAEEVTQTDAYAKDIPSTPRPPKRWASLQIAYTPHFSSSRLKGLSRLTFAQRNISYRNNPVQVQSTTMSRMRNVCNDESKRVTLLLNFSVIWAEARLKIT